MCTITNISVGQLVCTLKDGSTLRLGYKESTTVKGELITPYLKSIEKKGYVKITTLPEKVATTTKK